jgi:hypothetical protein
VFLVQHGFGNAGNVDLAISQGSADGVIWSPSNYKAHSLEHEVRANKGAIQMLDPQLYVAYAPGQIDPKQLGDYPWHEAAHLPNGERRPMTPAVAKAIVKASLDYQNQGHLKHLTEVVAPAPAIGDSAHINRLIAFNSTASTQWRKAGDGRPLFASVPLLSPLLDKAAGQQRHAVVGALSRLDVDGIYLLVELDPALDDGTYAAHLEAALWIVERLSRRSRVRVGYTGLNGWVFRAAGAEASATGWFQNRRSWSPSNWLARKGGSRLERAALKAPLALLTPADLAAVRDANLNLFQQLVSGAGPLAARLRASPARAGDEISLSDHAAQLFAVCHELDHRVGTDFQTDARRILSEVSAATALRGRIAAAALTIEGTATDGKPQAWKDALRGLAKKLSVQL